MDALAGTRPHSHVPAAASSGNSSSRSRAVGTSRSHWKARRSGGVFSSESRERRGKTKKDATTGITEAYMQCFAASGVFRLSSMAVRIAPPLSSSVRKKLRRSPFEEKYTQAQRASVSITAASSQSRISSTVKS